MSGGENQSIEQKVSALEKRLREMELKLESKPSPCSEYYIDSVFRVLFSLIGFLSEQESLNILLVILASFTKVCDRLADSKGNCNHVSLYT